MNQNLFCGYCKFNYTLLSRPKLLFPCGHIFCSRCVEQFPSVCPLDYSKIDGSTYDLNFLNQQRSLKPNTNSIYDNRNKPTENISHTLNITINHNIDDGERTRKLIKPLPNKVNQNVDQEPERKFLLNNETNSDNNTINNNKIEENDKNRDNKLLANNETIKLEEELKTSETTQQNQAFSVSLKKFLFMLAIKLILIIYYIFHIILGLYNDFMISITLIIM
jgi:hypothetical protein